MTTLPLIIVSNTYETRAKVAALLCTYANVHARYAQGAKIIIQASTPATYRAVSDYLAAEIRERQT